MIFHVKVCSIDNLTRLCYYKGMSTAQQIKTNTTQHTNPARTSSLERLSLGFEYNKTLRDIKREVRERTL